MARMNKLLQRKHILIVSAMLFIVVVSWYTIAWPNNKRNPIILLYRGLEDKLDTNPDLPIRSWGSCGSFKGRSRHKQDLPYTDDLEIFRDTTPFVGEIENDFEIIQKSDQIRRLRESLEVIEGKTVLLIFTDREYTTIYLNWLAHVVVQLDGRSLLKHHLLIALDSESCRFCQKIPINCFCIDGANFLSDLKLENPTMSRRFSSEIWIIRMDLIWLMSYWGYDLFLMDADAVPNSAEFLDFFLSFKEDHLVSSYGYYPWNVDGEWGRAVCMGVLLIRSLRDSDGICSLFKALKHSVVADDQIAYNLALYSLNFTFHARNIDGSISILDPKSVDKDYDSLRGTSNIGQLKMSILPESVVCRTNCTFFRTENTLLAFHPTNKVSFAHLKIVLAKLDKAKIPGPSDVKVTAMKVFDIWRLKPGAEELFKNFDGKWDDLKSTLLLFLEDG